MSPLQKAKLIKSLKLAIIDVKAAKGLSKAKAIQQVLHLRQELGLNLQPVESANPVNVPAYPALDEMESIINSANYDPIKFDEDYGNSLERLINNMLAGDDIEAVKRLETVLDTQTANLVNSINKHIEEVA